METKQKISLMKISVISIALGIWVIVFQLAGVLPSTQKVYVVGGEVAADIKNPVNVSGSVNVDNTIDINLAEINGQSDVFFNNPTRGHSGKYYRLPVTSN